MIFKNFSTTYFEVYRFRDWWFLHIVYWRLNIGDGNNIGHFWHRNKTGVLNSLVKCNIPRGSVRPKPFDEVTRIKKNLITLIPDINSLYLINCVNFRNFQTSPPTNMFQSVIQRAALGRVAKIGALYDIRSESFLVSEMQSYIDWQLC